MKKILMFLMMGIFMFSLVSASMKITNIPDDITSFEEWKQKVLQANAGTGYFAVTYPWSGACSQTCLDLSWFGDCNPCQNGEVATQCTWHPDSMSVIDPWNSANEYCDDWLKPYDYYNKQCYCKTPTTQCSGGADPGDRKCQGDEVWRCDNSGTWEYVSDCDYGCSSGSCQQQQCVDHTTKSCEGNSVYWFDSCGERQEEYERCESDENCEGDRCVRFCEEKFIGSKLCSGLNIVQQYQYSDCTTNIRTVETCQHGCENSQCKNPQCPTCSEPTDWSQCSVGEMFRTNYKCDSTTNYECRSFTEEQSCECGTSGQCQYDEICESNVCVKLECEENEIADSHTCIKKSSPVLLISIIIGSVVFILMIVLVVVIMKMGSRGMRR
ncbi:MAG: hypothetical protein U9Q73_00340 [Nanoarchaeota archaeon]|nr:hypothetical protein [Nanoarchaeota archaeon]